MYYSMISIRCYYLVSKMGEDEKLLKKMVSTSDWSANHPFASGNTQHLTIKQICLMQEWRWFIYERQKVFVPLPTCTAFPKDTLWRQKLPYKWILWIGNLQFSTFLSTPTLYTNWEEKIWVLTVRIYLLLKEIKSF